MELVLKPGTGAHGVELFGGSGLLFSWVFFPFVQLLVVESYWK